MHQGANCVFAGAQLIDFSLIGLDQLKELYIEGLGSDAGGMITSLLSSLPSENALEEIHIRSSFSYIDANYWVLVLTVVDQHICGTHWPHMRIVNVLCDRRASENDTQRFANVMPISCSRGILRVSFTH
jgi:hypothetical protein